MHWPSPSQSPAHPRQCIFYCLQPQLWKGEVSKAVKASESKLEPEDQISRQVTTVVSGLIFIIGRRGWNRIVYCDVRGPWGSKNASLFITWQKIPCERGCLGHKLQFGGNPMSYKSGISNFITYTHHSRRWVHQPSEMYVYILAQRSRTILVAL